MAWIDRRLTLEALEARATWARRSAYYLLALAVAFAVIDLVLVDDGGFFAVPLVFVLVGSVQWLVALALREAYHLRRAGGVAPEEDARGW